MRRQKKSIPISYMDLSHLLSLKWEVEVLEKTEYLILIRLMIYMYVEEPFTEHAVWLVSY